MRSIWKVRCDLVFRKKSHNSVVTANNIIKFINNYNIVNNTGHNIMEDLYYNSKNDVVLQITKYPVAEIQMIWLCKLTLL